MARASTSLQPRCSAISMWARDPRGSSGGARRERAARRPSARARRGGRRAGACGVGAARLERLAGGRALVERRPLDLARLEGLEHVAVLHVVEAVEEDAAFEAFRDLTDVVLEPLQL